MTLSVVNAFVDGSDVVILTRGESGLEEKRVRAEYSFFVEESEFPDDLARSLRGSSAVRSMKREGKYVRIAWIDDWIRRDMVRGKKSISRDRYGVPGETEPVLSPFQARSIKMFEGDVDPIRRWFTDTGSGVARPRRGYFDIETDSRKTIREAIEGKSRILSMSVADESEEKQWLGILEADSDAAERKLLQDWWDTIQRFGLEQLLAWNGEKFDFPVIAKRIDRLCLPIDLRRILLLDHMVMFRRMNLNSSDSGDEKQSMALAAIAQAQIGEGKEEIPPEVAKRWPGRSLGSLSWELWSSGGAFRELLGRYNMKDTLLMPRIEKKTGFAALFDTLCDVCRVLPDSRGLLPTQQMDGFMLRLGEERGFRFPTKEFRDGESDPFEGAFVMEPKKTGILRDVHVADFASLYPSVIITWNMSPETLRDIPVNGPIPEGHCRSPLTGVGFSTETEGMLPAALKTMIGLRKEWSDKQANLPPGTPEAKEAGRRSMAYKVAANSFYGVVGSPFSRYFNRRVAESVTQNSVWLIKRTISEAEDRKMSVFYGDTDSFFADGVSQTEYETFVKWCNEDLYPRILKSVGCTENRIKLAYEKAFAILVMVGKKRYAGRFLHYKGTSAKPVPREGEKFDKNLHSKPEIKGLEYKRGDATVLARRLQERAIMALMREDVRLETYRDMVRGMLDYVANDVLPIEEVQLSKSLSKKVGEYRRKTPTGKDAELPPHVKVAEKMIAAGREIGEGSRVAYVIVDGSDGIEAIPADEYDGTLDRYYLWEHLIYPATMRVLEKAFPDADWSTGLEKVRPKKPRGGKAKAGQGNLFPAVEDALDPIGAKKRADEGLRHLREEAWERSLLDEMIRRSA